MELDRARLKQKLDQIKEDKDDVTGAESITQMLQVEDYGQWSLVISTESGKQKCFL